jgi:predicted phosphodiesterase
MTHIGGYPGHYYPSIKGQLDSLKPNLFVAGHSHILKIMYDQKLQCLHLNPGAAGKSGFHKVRSLLRFIIDKDDIKDMEIIELSDSDSTDNA